MSYIGLDLDGTILNYNAHSTEIRTNPALPAMLPPKSTIVIISNQGGLPFNRISAGQVSKRLLAARAFLESHHHQLAWCYFSTYHPQATAATVLNAAKRLRHTLIRDNGYIYGYWSIFATERSRKPSPYMLKLTEIAAYYGDSPEDEQAAKAARIPFVKVQRFE